MQIDNTTGPAILSSASMQGRFCSNICILVRLYLKRTWPCLLEQPKINVQRLQTFLRGFVSDKIGINLLLRPLLWVLKNNSYI